MKNFLYELKVKYLNKLDRYKKKNQRPLYNELEKYKEYVKSKDNHIALGFGAGRTGQSWFSRIFNNHQNWIGSHERFPDYEAFYRYITFYDLPISKENFFNLLKLSAYRDMSKYQNTFISSPYFSFGVNELVKEINPNFIFFNLRNPINSVESFFQKGWYIKSNEFNNKSPLIDISNNLYRSFSRIIPKQDFLDEWNRLTRIGKITWFWALTNQKIYEDFEKIKNIEKFYLKLEDIDQNYDFYERLSTKFLFEKKLSKKGFLQTKIITPNIELGNEYKYNEWNSLEKNEFENILTQFFPYYDKINTNI